MTDELAEAIIRLRRKQAEYRARRMEYSNETLEENK